MDIKTKYNIGDKVFYVDQNAIKRGIINGIVFTQNKRRTNKQLER